MRQLPLPIELKDSAIFKTFLAGPNAVAVAHLKAVAAGADGPGGWLWGPASSGKSHLLQAVCAATGDAGKSAAYIPMEQMRPFGPEVLEGWDEQRLLAIDDLDRVAGDSEWETALFNLYNGLIDRGGALIVATERGPSGIEFDLPDLRSRLSAGAVFQLVELDEAGIAAALRLRAQHRGLELPDETIQYLLRRVPRDMESMYGLLERLDVESLAEQRKLTVPFVRSIIAGGSSQCR